jgi:hypothetical protein
MGDDLGVAVCDELVSARPELLSSLDVIKQFAVENYGDAAVFVEDRLLPISQSDNAQPPCSQGESGSNQKALFVWAAMQQRPGHSLNTPFGHGTLSRQIDHTCDAAHDVIVLVPSSSAG